MERRAPPRPDRTRTAAGAPLVEVTRGPFSESVHHGHVALIRGPAGEEGRLETLRGSDPRVPVVCRSAIKSLQALPLLERGGADTYGLTGADLALMVASHEGTERHTAAVADLLRRTGIAVDDLACGPHAPFDAATRRRMLSRGEQPTRLHNNCSGKHAGFVLLARDRGLGPAASVDPDAEPQRLVRRAVAEMARLDPDALGVAIDGCGAPTLQMPLDALARAFRRMLVAAGPDGMNLAGVSAVRAAACSRILEAIHAEPVLVAGEGRLCTALIRAFPGRVWPKNGAEGVYVMALRIAAEDGGAMPRFGPRDQVYGLAVKASDGATRGYQAFVAALADELAGRVVGDAGAGGDRGLAELAIPVLRNTRGANVGVVRPLQGLRAFEPVAADVAGEGAPA